ncbi:MAG TPA: HhH-GPD-type base excision DNA repair protein [Candidatus Limnocylindria bacterium]|nr:HhH-GPD-type base excision DNA repair protein [Candidatus Limnocylindria bacterium]
MTSHALRLAQDPAADQLLSDDPFALLVGMLLDQQFPMERAFAGPRIIAERLGTPDRLDPTVVAATDPEAFRALMTGPPAVHRYPGSMGERVQAVAATVVASYGGDASLLWTSAADGADLLQRLMELPGFGRQKSQIFVALLGKQLGVTPAGWKAAAGAYAEAGSRRSVADVRDPATLAEVRAYKQEAKAAVRAAKGG